MKKGAHRLFLTVLVLIVLGTLIFLAVNGINYYQTNVSDRVFLDQHESLKPSGFLGHGLGIIGTVLIITGISSYMIRKRWRLLSRVGLLKHWLEFHIFLCSLGPVMILFHTAFKFGGIVAVSFWSMVAVVLSGILGRFIYLQIPRTIEGRELSLQEATAMKKRVADSLPASINLPVEVAAMLQSSLNVHNDGRGNSTISKILNRFRTDAGLLRSIRSSLKTQRLGSGQYRKTIKLIRSELRLNRRIDLLVTMQNLLKYWHVAHMPFALVMLIIMSIHVAITLIFGYHWIF
jgi:hypothetical protein